MRRIIQVLAGALLMALAYKGVFDATGLVTGGFSGIGIIAGRVAGIPMWLTNIVLNVPVFAVAYRINGKEFVKVTLLGTVALTFFLGIIPNINVENKDYLLASVYGGIICGVGIGLVLSAGASTGGTDMVAAIVNKCRPEYPLVWIIQLLDGAIVALGIAVFGINTSLYAIIAIYITSRVCNRVIDGPKVAKCLIIISRRADEIAGYIMNEMNRGVTAIEGRGMYSDSSRKMLYCIVSNKESIRLKKLVKDLDDAAFAIISDVTEVLGDGF